MTAAAEVEAAAASARRVRRGGEVEACGARTAGRNRCEEAHFNWRTCSHSMRTVSSSSLRPLPPARGRGALARIACAPCREARSARCRLAAAAALGRGLVAAAILHQILHTQQATGFPSAPSASSLELLNPSWDATPEFDGEVLRAERSRLGHASAPFVVASRSCDMHFRGARSYTVPVR